MLRNCKKCNALTEKKICRKCTIEDIVKRFENNKINFKLSELKEIARYYAINPRKAVIEVPEELRVMAMQNRLCRNEARRYNNIL